MKRIFITICIFFVFVTIAGAAEFQKCVDKDGNVVITDNPPPDAKCGSIGGNESATPQKSESAKKPDGDIESEQKEVKDKLSDQQSQMNKLKKIPRLNY